MKLLFTSDRESPHVESSTLGSRGKKQIPFSTEKRNGCDMISELVN